MPVSNKHPLYETNFPRWKLVRDCVEGSKAVKTASLADGDNVASINNEPGTLYLPAPNPTDISEENRLRYRSYRRRANFVNFTGNTLDGFTGMVAHKPSVFELDTSIEHLVDNADGAGLPLQQFAQRIISEGIQTGRDGLLTDYPITPEGLTRAQTIELRPYIKRYPAESIINWETEIINGREVLTMVVLAEKHCRKDPFDKFKKDEVTRHRVLLLQDGVYVQELYDEDDKLIVDEAGNGQLIPRKADGSLWTEIPFTFVGTIDNNSTPDKSLLYDIAEVNIAHYRNSADFEESSFMVGQPTPVLAGLTNAWVKDVLKDNVHLGSRGAIPLPEGGSATLLQASPNQLPELGMVMKEKQMIQIGAKIITDSGQAETAEAAKIRFAGQNSKLGTLVTNVEDALIKCADWAVMFAGGREGQNEINLNREFFDARIDPQLLIAKIQLLDRSVIAPSDIRDDLRKVGQIDNERTDQDIDDEIRDMPPIRTGGGGFGF